MYVLDTNVVSESFLLMNSLPLTNRSYSGYIVSHKTSYL